MIGNNIKHLVTVDSTNTHAQYLLSVGHEPDGTIIISSNQNNGRGMQQNSWQSEKGMNLTFSIIIYPHFLEINNVFSLNQFVSLAICNSVIELTGLTFKVKWPNDVMYENSKICGILIENNLRGNRIVNSVIGIGLNVNQTVFLNFIPKATSLKLITSLYFDLNTVLKLVCKKLNEYYEILKQGDYRFLYLDYQKNLFRFNEEHLFKKNDVYFKGVIKGVQADGKLIIADDHNTSSIIDVKEIQFVY